MAFSKKISWETSRPLLPRNFSQFICSAECKEQKKQKGKADAKA